MGSHRRGHQCWSLIVAGLLLGSGILSACGQSSSLDPETQLILQRYANRPRLEGSAAVNLNIQTAQANIQTITLYLEGDSAPLTAGNFVDLVLRGFYNGLSFQRVEKDPEPFIVQGGYPSSDSIGKFLDPETQRPRRIPLEIWVMGELHPRYNQLIDVTTTGAKLALPHKLGAIAMARSNAVDSGSSQFYITLSALPILDGRYAVFGYVTEGIEWVEKIEVGDKILSAEVIEGLENLKYPQTSP